MSTPRNKQASWFKKAEHVKLAKNEVRKSSIDLGAFSIAFTGLTSGSAQIGNHLSIGYTIDPDNGTETVAWGTIAGDSTYGTGANPTNFTAGDGGNLVVTVTDGGETLSRSAPIRYAFGTAPSIAAQVWVVDTTVVNLNAAAPGANLTFSYSAVGLPTGLTINSATGVITGTPTVQVSGNIQVTAVDQYGSALVYAFSYQSNFRSAAAVANGLGPFSWTVNDTSVSVDATTDFTTNGNTLTYTATGLPAGVTIASNGVISGTPTAASSGTIVVTGQDEYGRETTSTMSHTTTLRAQATGGVDLDLSFVEDSAITATNLAANWTANGNTLTYTVSPALPANLSMSTAASLTGTPTVVTADATYTLIGTDEYGRQTSDTFTLEITATADVTAPVLSGAIGTQTGQTTATWAVTSDEANGTIYAGVRPTASAALTSAQLIAGAGGAGVAWSTDATPTADGNNGGSFTGLTAATAYRVDVVQVDAAGNTSAVVSSAEFTTASAGASFTPADLFAASEDGLWHDATDFDNLKQNSDGTTAVASGDPVGYMSDASGKGRHAIQATAGKRPLAGVDANGNNCLIPDGVDDAMRSPWGDIFSATPASDATYFLCYNPDQKTTTVVPARPADSDSGTETADHVNYLLVSFADGSASGGQYRATDNVGIVHDVTDTFGDPPIAARVIIQKDATVAEVFVNDVSQGTGTVSVNIATIGFGQRNVKSEDDMTYFSNGNFNAYSGGYFYGSIWTDDLLSSSERADLDAYYSARST